MNNQETDLFTKENNTNSQEMGFFNRKIYLFKLKLQSDKYCKIRNKNYVKYEKEITRLGNSKLYSLLNGYSIFYYNEIDKNGEQEVIFSPSKRTIGLEKKVRDLIKLLEKDNYIKNVNELNFTFTTRGVTFHQYLNDYWSSHKYTDYVDAKFQELLEKDNKLMILHNANCEYEKEIEKDSNLKNAKYDQKIQSIMLKKYIPIVKRNYYLIKVGNVIINHSGDGCDIDRISSESSLNISKDITKYVPKDTYFVLGDDRYASTDSRYFEDPYINKKRITAVFLNKLN